MHRTLTESLLRFLPVLVLFFGVCPSALAVHTIGINFNSNADVDVDNVTGTAGTVPQANWNNTENRSGSVPAGSVINESGATVGGMSVAWTADAAHAVGGNDGTGEGDDTALMHGGLEAQDETYTGDNEIALTGIPYARYNLYIYVNGWNDANRDGEIQLAVGGSVAPGSQRQFDVMGLEFVDGTHTHSESTGVDGEGTYVLWENLTAANVTAQARKISDNMLITGLQVVEVEVPVLSDQVVGVNFNANNAALVDLVTGIAGAVPHANWNNTSGRMGAAAGAVLEAGGASLEGMAVSWTANAAHPVGGSNGTGEGDDTALMHGGLEAQDATYTGTNEITLTGIPYADYSLYLYVNGWNTAERDGEAQLEIDGSVVTESQRQFDVMGAEFVDGTHVHSESTGADDEGTYVLWENLTAADLVVQFRKIGLNTMITGLQIAASPPDGTILIVR